MCKVSVYEAKTNFSKYCELLESGAEEEVVVSRYGKKIVKIIRYTEDKPTKRVGAGIGKLADVPYTLDDLDGDIPALFGY